MLENKKNGFTLVELLVAISILGIITILALPQISNIQNNNRLVKYEKYADTIISSGKLYIDAYNEDLFGNSTSGCIDISYNQLRSKNLLKEFKEKKTTCNSENTFVRVRKQNENYTYEISIVCTDKNGKVVYDKRLAKDGCNNLGPDTTPPTITFTPNGHDWTTGQDKTVKIKVFDENGMLENIKIKYIWMKDDEEIGTYKTYSFKNKRYEGPTSTPLETTNIDLPQGVTGNYYLKVVPIDVRDSNGNYQLSSAVSKVFKLDNEKPTCANIIDNITWTKENVNIEITCNDTHSGCIKETYKKEYNSGTVLTDSLKIKDNVGNEETCTYSVYLDKEAPLAPNNGKIGKVSGSNITGTIQTTSSNTTDVNNGSGFKEIRYVITNSSSTPSKESFISSSTTFTRSCGTSYYAYAVAVDNVGNISAPYSLGSTKDGKDEYSSYGECSKSCGKGTKTRTNTCDLITTDLTSSCNEQDCCSSTKTNWGKWTSCSAECGGGIKSRSGTIVSKYDGSTCDYDYEEEACNTTSCAPTYTPYDCKLRGEKKHYNLTSWKCDCGSWHTSAYIHYCADGNGNLITKGDNSSINKYWYVCPNSTSGWEIIPGY